MVLPLCSSVYIIDTKVFQHINSIGWKKFLTFQFEEIFHPFSMTHRNIALVSEKYVRLYNYIVLYTKVNAGHNNKDYTGE